MSKFEFKLFDTLSGEHPFVLPLSGDDEFHADVTMWLEENVGAKGVCWSTTPLIRFLNNGGMMAAGGAGRSLLNPVKDRTETYRLRDETQFAAFCLRFRQPR